MADQNETADWENKYQSPHKHNKLLPYSDQIDAEADKLFSCIKQNLSRAVQMRELWPGTLYWTNRLSSYLMVYGYHFTKEDHIYLIKFLYNLILIPNLESPLLNAWSALLVKLLKKRRLLSPDDLQLKWRPVYDLWLRIFHTKFKRLGMKIYTERCINTVRILISHLRCYFPIESTQEMLDEWRPLLCPFDTAMLDAAEYFSEFLPTLLIAEQHQFGYRLWFDEFVKLWLDIRNHSPLNDAFLKLFARLARDNVGHIDWTPHMPRIFTRILNGFILPMGPKELQTVQRKEKYNGDVPASLIVSMLGGGSPAQDHLDSLMAATQSYYHPSNTGFHSKKLLVFLKSITTRFILRLKKERYSSKKTWEPPVPDHAKLTEDDIDRFVQCLLPSLWLSVFSKLGSLEAASSVQNLALIRPEMVLPELMERTYTALETLTEPHQVVSTLTCVTAVCRILFNSHKRYPEGRSHLFTLLRLAIPGIDTNDFRKMLASGMLISSLTILVPLVDCSSAIGHVDMTQEEIDLCSETAMFEEFVVQLLERCFLLIENSTGQHGMPELGNIMSELKVDSHESMMGLGLSGVINSVLGHCSPELFQIVLEKLFQFVTTHVYDDDLGSRICGEIISVASKIDPVSTLNKFVPHCVSNIDSILKGDPDQHNSENPDIELLWNIHILSEVSGAEGTAVLSHADSIVSCLKQVVHLKSTKGARFAAKMVSSMLFCLTQTYPLESSIIPIPLNLSPKDHLYIRDWGKSCSIEDTAIKWHNPSPPELQLTVSILDKLLKPELNTLQDFMEEKIKLDRETLLQRLELVEHIINGITAFLPPFTGTQVDGCPASVVDLTRQCYIKSVQQPVVPDEYSRETLAVFFHKLTAFITKTCEDDTKSIIMLIKILKLLLNNFGLSKLDLDAKWTTFKQTKSAMGDRLRGSKNSIRLVNIIRAQLQHEVRLTDMTTSPLTALHLSLFEDLVDMAVSVYPKVRIAAQQTLAFGLDGYLFATRMLLPRVLPLLKKDERVTHEQFKGALYILLTPPMTASIVHDWQLMRQILPLLAMADHSEKPSILNLMSHLHNTIQKTYDVFAIKFEISDKCITAAIDLHNAVSREDSEIGVQKLDKFNTFTARMYKELVEELVTITEKSQNVTQWRFTEITTKLLAMLVRHDHPYPLKGIQLLLNGLVHESISLRKVSIFAVSLILQQLKRVHKKVELDIKKLSGVGDSVIGAVPGEREDNRWLCINQETSEKDEEEHWDSNDGIVHKTRDGFYCYPKILYGYAPVSEQPKLNRPLDELPEAEQIIYKAFTSEEFVGKLISYLSLEENKGNDSYNPQRVFMFKNLFRNYGSCVVSIFQPHLEKLAVDSQESNQRCACEIITALVRGSKHWSYKDVKALRSWLEPLLKKVFINVSVETVDDWFNGISEMSADRDPHQILWLLNLLMDGPLRGVNGSFIDSSRLHLLHAGMAQQEWRIPHLLHQMSSYLANHLVHSFKNVRDKIGSVLSSIYMMDISCMGYQVQYNPRLDEMLKQFSSQIPSPQELLALPKDSPTLRLCKTAMNTIINTYHPSYPEFYQLFALVLPLAAFEGDDEIGHLIRLMCIQLCRQELLPSSIPIVLSALRQALSSGLWKVKVPVLHLLQVLVFWNLHTFQAHVDDLSDIVLSLMSDPQIEVREVAAATMSGLVRCGFITQDKIKSTFIKQSRSKLPKKQKKEQLSNGLEETDSLVQPQNHRIEGHLTQRHSGVLGLAALVEAYPYDVPDWLPEIVDELSGHLHDPAPIKDTVKKTMSEFKRTHYDNWREHKLKFTEDQLSALSDLLVSPSYYC